MKRLARIHISKLTFLAICFSLTVSFLQTYKGNWLLEESFHYFPRNTFLGFINPGNLKVYDLGPLPPEILTAFPFNFFTLINPINMHEIFFSGIFFVSIHMTLLFLSVYWFGSLFLSSQFVCFFFTITLCSTFVSLNSASYSSKSLGIAYSLVALKLIHSNPNLSSKSFLVRGFFLSILCTGMLSNLGVLLFSSLFLIIFSLLLSNSKKQHFLPLFYFFIGSWVWNSPLLYTFYIKNGFVSSMIQNSNNFYTKFHSSFEILFGGGSWSQFESYAGGYYYPWYPRERLASFVFFYMSILAFLLILRFGRNKSLFQKLKSFGLSISTNEPKLEISKYLVVFGITLGLLIALPSKVNPLFYLVSNHPEFFGIFREPWSKLYFYALLILLLPIWIKIDKLAWALDEYQASISTEIALSENRKQRQTLLFNSRKNVFRKLIVIRLAVILSLAPLIHFTVWNLTRPSQNLPPYVQTIKERQNFLFEVLNAAEILNTGKGYVVCIENSQASWYVAIESLISNALGSSKSDFRSSPAYNSFTRCDDLQEVEEIAMVNCKEQKSFVGVYLSARSELCFTSESIIRANTALLSEATQINGKLYSKRK